jgi:hypothetical protein
VSAGARPVENVREFLVAQVAFQHLAEMAAGQNIGKGDFSGYLEARQPVAAEPEQIGGNICVAGAVVALYRDQKNGLAPARILDGRWQRNR